MNVCVPESTHVQACLCRYRFLIEKERESEEKPVTHADDRAKTFSLGVKSKPTDVMNVYLRSSYSQFPM